ncbi:ABC transporter permease [Celerinatantimonas sp. YJH-8]|uniref:ABC transporter permease n=1 Tax=Celerinatantimonas sp. YJH-8 TaxID=3228714 RepID=UPI0038C8959D
MTALSIYREKIQWHLPLLFPLLVIVAFMFIAVFADQIAPPHALLPSQEALAAPSLQHWLGTDDLGIDIFSLMCRGTRNSLAIGLLTALLACLMGTGIGTLSAYMGGQIDRLLMRVTDIVMALPRLPTLIVCASFFSPSTLNIVLVLLLFSWAHPARILRAKVLALKQQPYIWLAQSYGAHFPYLLKQHFLPEIYPLCILSFTGQLNHAIIAEAGLSLLGLGDPNAHSWGMLLNSAMAFDGLIFTPFWKWWVLPPLVAIASLVMAITLLSRHLEALMDPKGICHTPGYRR